MQYLLDLCILIINYINKLINYLFPYKSIILFDNFALVDITFFYYCLYFINYLIPGYYINRLYKIHIRSIDKYYIYDGKLSDIKIPSISYQIKKPRNLFAKYKLFINKNEVSLEEKINLKKYLPNTKIEDICKFDGVILNELQVIKNNIDFKTYNEGMQMITIDDIYEFL
jgi:hypothetical protein